MTPPIRSPEICTTWSDHGSKPPPGAGLYWANAGDPLAMTGTRREPRQPMPGAEAPAADVEVGLQPQLVGRHRPGGILVQQRGQCVHVVLLEGGDVAIQQCPLAVVHQSRGLGCAEVFRGERGARALQRAVDRRDRGAQQLGDLVGLPVEDLAQDEHGSLARRQVLERGHEGQADRLPGHREVRRIAARGHGTIVRNGLDPGALG